MGREMTTKRSFQNDQGTVFVILKQPEGNLENFGRTSNPENRGALRSVYFSATPTSWLRNTGVGRTWTASRRSSRGLVLRWRTMRPSSSARAWRQTSGTGGGAPPSAGGMDQGAKSTRNRRNIFPHKSRIPSPHKNFGKHGVKTV